LSGPAFVLDNSVAMRWLLNDGSDADLQYAHSILGRIAHDAARPHGPCTLPLEAANVIARAEARGLLTQARSAAFIELLDRVQIELDAETASRALSDTLALSRRFGLSSYDASYLELALRRGLPLATLDSALRAACGQTDVPVFGH